MDASGAAATRDAPDARDERLRAVLAEWGPSTMDRESDISVKLEHLGPGFTERQRDALRALRRSLDADGRKAKAEEYKTLANAQFGKQAWRVALVGYLAGAWMLRRDAEDPPCPKVVVNHLSELGEAVGALGSAKVCEGAAAEADGAAALRTSLRVNLAAAALKLNEWRIARAACEAVLACDPAHAKALWRLAKAHEGDSNLTDAMAVARRLVKADASNKEASRLLEALERRKAKQGKMFGSIVERAQAEGDDLYTMKEHERDISVAMHEGFIRCMSRPNPGEEDLVETASEKAHGQLLESAERGERVTVGEHMETMRREHAARKEAKGPMGYDEARLLKVMGKAYMDVRTQREEGVRQALPPSVLASYVEE